MKNDYGYMDIVTLVAVVAILTMAILVAPMVYTLYQLQFGEKQVSNITIEQIYPATHGFANNNPAYVITTDGDIFDVSDLIRAKLREGKSYNVEWVNVGSSRTGTVLHVQNIK